eukprot:365132-Chlamydomonas_euryale.AAC.2
MQPSACCKHAPACSPRTRQTLPRPPRVGHAPPGRAWVLQGAVRSLPQHLPTWEWPVASAAAAMSETGTLGLLRLPALRVGAAPGRRAPERAATTRRCRLRSWASTAARKPACLLPVGVRPQAQPRTCACQHAIQHAAMAAGWAHSPCMSHWPHRLH